MNQRDTRLAEQGFTPEEVIEIDGKEYVIDDKAPRGGSPLESAAQRLARLQREAPGAFNNYALHRYVEEVENYLKLLVEGLNPCKNLDTYGGGAHVNTNPVNKFGRAKEFCSTNCANTSHKRTQRNRKHNRVVRTQSSYGTTLTAPRPTSSEAASGLLEGHLRGRCDGGELGTGGRCAGRREFNPDCLSPAEWPEGMYPGRCIVFAAYKDWVAELELEERERRPGGVIEYSYGLSPMTVPVGEFRMWRDEAP